MYEKGLFRQNSFPVPVISIGNLVLGGTGKTPTVSHLANLLIQHGHHPAIISRGYGGKAKLKANVVSDGHTLYLAPEQAGDEPYMLAETLPGVPILTGTKRFHPCRMAVENYNVDVLILDDGFQHLAIKRDIDIVLFDGTDLAGNKRIFPGGVLREPESALHRCHAFMITGINDKNKELAERFGESLKIRFKSKPVFFATLGRLSLRCPDNNSAGVCAEGPFFAFCGIANPSRFQESLNSMSIQQSGFLALPDHVCYSQAMMTDICIQAVTSGAKKLVTTQKDFVKLKKFDSTLLRHVVEIGFQPEKSFDLFVTESMQRVNTSYHAQMNV